MKRSGMRARALTCIHKGFKFFNENPWYFHVVPPTHPPSSPPPERGKFWLLRTVSRTNMKQFSYLHSEIYNKHLICFVISVPTPRNIFIKARSESRKDDRSLALGYQNGQDKKKSTKQKPRFVSHSTHFKLDHRKRTWEHKSALHCVQETFVFKQNKLYLLQKLALKEACEMFASRQLHVCSCGKGHLLSNDSVKGKKTLNINNPAGICTSNLVAAYPNRLLSR